MQNSSPPAFDSARAWIVSCAAFVASFVAYGFLYAFGAFLRPMGVALGVGHALMSTLFSCMSLSGYLLGPLTGDWADHVGPRKVMASGAVVFTGGLIATAHAHNFAVAFACLGVGVGAGLASVYVPSLAAVGEWFKKERAMALGIAVSGIGVGTLVAAPLSAWLIREYGWRNTLTIQGVGGGSLLLLSALFMFQPPVRVESNRGSRAVWSKRYGAAHSCSCFCPACLAGCQCSSPWSYLPALATKEGVAMRRFWRRRWSATSEPRSLLSRIRSERSSRKRLEPSSPFQFSCVLVRRGLRYLDVCLLLSCAGCIRRGDGHLVRRSGVAHPSCGHSTLRPGKYRRTARLSADVVWAGGGGRTAHRRCTGGPQRKLSRRHLVCFDCFPGRRLSVSLLLRRAPACA